MSTWVVALAWFGLFNGLGALVTVLVLLNRVRRPLAEIERYADATLAAGLGIARNLDAVDEAERTRHLAEAVPRGVRAFLGSLLER